MKKQYILASLVGIILVAWTASIYIPNDNFGEASHSSSRDKKEMVYFNTGGKDPMTLDCLVVMMPEVPTTPQVVQALSEASRKANAGCVAIQWIPE